MILLILNLKKDASLFNCLQLLIIKLNSSEG
jgi:hypothetical protein